MPCDNTGTEKVKRAVWVFEKPNKKNMHYLGN